MIRALAVLLLLVLVIIGGLVSGQITRNTSDTRCVKGHIEFHNGPVWYEVASFQFHWAEFEKVCTSSINAKTGEPLQQ